jgi:1-acyl-sn-glycerol-3-phosphate acyltransferase
MNRTFHSFSIKTNLKDKGLPVLLICNHVSWWDGIWSFYVNRKLFKRKFHFMMLEEQLRKNWFLGYTGGFSVSRNSRKVVESIQYAAELLRDNNNLLLFYPQGEIESIHRQDFVFQKGIGRILNLVQHNIQVVFLVCLVDYFSNVKPVVNAYVHEYEGKYSHKDLQDEYNNFYKRCLTSQIQNKSQ